MSLENLKREILDPLAEKDGLAIVVVDEKSREVSASNNNSMCRLLYSSADFGPACGEYCGKAFVCATEAGKTINYECHAGLTCNAVPIKYAGKQLVAILGRTFLKAENYRKATEKAISGDWRKFRPTEFFENILMTGSSAQLDRATQRVESLVDREPDDLLEIEKKPVAAPEPSAQKPALQAPQTNDISKRIEQFHAAAKQTRTVPAIRNPDSTSVTDGANEIAAWRSLFGSLMKLDYRRACDAFLDFLTNRYGLSSVIWFHLRDKRFESFLSRGTMQRKSVQLGILPDNPRLYEAMRNEAPLELLERPKAETGGHRRILNFFPLTIGGEIRGGVAVEGEMRDTAKKRNIARLTQAIASQLEILRLRDEVSRRDWLSRAVRRFNESLKRIDTDDFWTHITQISAELLQAERASLLVRDEKLNSLSAKATVGARVNLFSDAEVGSRISRLVLEDGNPLVISDIRRAGLQSAPIEWSYKTPSFISYPVLIGERRIAILNFTDKATGDTFNDRDLELLQAIVPQIAVAIDRTTLKDKAGEYEQLSVTDALTGLLNRRYLQQRLDEELERSKRYRFPMSLLMLDVDKFKSYNDNYGHPAGDEALKIVANILKENLRGADVAARYGGEEFAILLPQTSSDEAAAIAERIRRHIERTDFPHRQVTVSIGIANSTALVSSVDDLVWAADRALYDAKDHGRNNVRIFDDLGNGYADKVH